MWLQGYKGTLQVCVGTHLGQLSGIAIYRYVIPPVQQIADGATCTVTALKTIAASKSWIGTNELGRAVFFLLRSGRRYGDASARGLLYLPAVIATAARLCW